MTALARDGLSTARTYSAQRVVLHAPDAVSYLSIYLVLLYVIPSNRSVGALGSIGAPSMLWGLGGLVLWVFFTIIRTPPAVDLEKPEPVDDTFSPGRIAQFALVGAVLASYITAMTRAIPFAEVSTADSGLIRIAAWTGIVLIAGDGISTLERLLVLVRRIVLVGSGVALLGVAQFAAGQSFVDMVSIPGLAVGTDYSALQVRGGEVRSAGTAVHPLEYGTMLAMILPVAVVLALRDRSRSPLRRWLPVVVIAAGMVLAGSRSAVIGLVVGLLVIVPALGRRERAGLLAAVVVFAGLAYVLVPSVVNNLRYLFVSAGDDPSAESRTAGLGLVGEFLSRSPAFGRGFGTFLPVYQILDNQFLGLLVEIGVVGLVAFVAVAVTAVMCAIIGAQALPKTTMLGRPSLERDLGFALAGSIVAGVVLFALFDGLSFAQAAGSLFLFVGLCAAYFRVARSGAVLAELDDAVAVVPSRVG